MSGAGKLLFQTRKTTITIDYGRCLPARSNTSTPECGFACVKACRLQGRNILKIQDDRPILAVTGEEEIKRLDNECLACEYQCSVKGPGCVSIEVRLGLPG
ncbi:MAG: hypothetical protein JRJ59_02965 [Deltaproteobacteria bacterium]|nr:hypothetical protein [Deltaproteobacteria bacterium]